MADIRPNGGEPPERAMPYSLLHSNVDGAGAIGRFETFEAARAEADRLQAESDAGGNPWGYRYSVFTGIDRCVYRTQPRRRS